MSNEPPDRLYIEESDSEIFDKLKRSEESPLNGKTNRTLFMMAMTTGFVSGDRVEVESPNGYVRMEYLDEDSDKALIKAIAVAEEGLDVLTDKKRVYGIAEEFATGGIHLLRDKAFGGEFGSFSKRLEAELREKFEDLGF